MDRKGNLQIPASAPVRKVVTTMIAKIPVGMSDARGRRDVSWGGCVKTAWIRAGVEKLTVDESATVFRRSVGKHDWLEPESHLTGRVRLHEEDGDHRDAEPDMPRL
jgi:hypothetical protein